MPAIKYSTYDVNINQSIFPWQSEEWNWWRDWRGERRGANRRGDSSRSWRGGTGGQRSVGFHADMCRFMSQWTYYIHIIACMHIVAYVQHNTYYIEYIYIYWVTYLCYEDLSRLILWVNESCLAFEQLLSSIPNALLCWSLQAETFASVDTYFILTPVSLFRFRDVNCFRRKVFDFAILSSGRSEGIEPRRKSRAVWKEEGNDKDINADGSQYNGQLQWSPPISSLPSVEHLPSKGKTSKN